MNPSQFKLQTSKEYLEAEWLQALGAPKEIERVVEVRVNELVVAAPEPLLAALEAIELMVAAPQVVAADLHSSAFIQIIYKNYYLNIIEY